MVHLTPIAVFTYNRPRHTKEVLQCLENCSRLDECDIYIYSDGPKNKVIDPLVMETRAIAREWADKHSAHLLEQSGNNGLTRSIVAGISELCSTYGRVIVIEDDLILSPDFIDYMLQGLERYQDDHRVHMISGYMYPVKNPTVPDAIFLPVASGWGWATWERTWDRYDPYAKGAELMLVDPDARKRFNLNGSSRFAEQLEAVLAGTLDTWDLQLYWSVFRDGGLVLHPRRSLTWNGGFDGSGVHCGADRFLQDPLGDFRLPRLGSPISWPNSIAIDNETVHRIAEFQRRQWPPRWQMMLRSLLPQTLRSAINKVRVRHMQRRALRPG